MCGDMMNYQETLDYLRNSQYAQLDKTDLAEIEKIQEELENAQFDQNTKEDIDAIDKSLEICRRLLR